MKKYDVFKSEGGYAVAIGIYLDCPVVGAMRWFETKEEAEKYAKNKKEYDIACKCWEENLKYISSDEVEKSQPPKEKDYNIDVGVTI